MIFCRPNLGSRRPQMLGVFDAETPVSRAVSLGHVLVDVQYPQVRLVADGVDHDLQARSVAR